MLNAVVHLHRNLLPREEAQIPLLQQGLQFDIGNRMDRRHDFLLQLNQIIHISFQAFLDLDYFYDSGFHLGAAMIRVTWHIAVNNGARCGQFV